MARRKARFKSSFDSIDPYSAGWNNYDNKFGHQTDPNLSTIFSPRVDLSTQKLIQLYESDPLVTRYINLIKGDATRKDYQLIDKDNPAPAQKLKKDLGKRFNVCGILSKSIGVLELFGGGVIYLEIEDGRKEDEPLNKNNIRKIWSIRVIDKDFCHPWTFDDLSKTETPGEPLHYNIQLMSPGKSESRIVHSSRVIRIPDIKSDDNLSQTQQQKRLTWPVSTIQTAYDTIKKHGVGFQSITQHLQNMVVDIFKVEGLERVRSTKEFADYIAMQWRAKNSMRANVLGKDESLERVGTPLTGVDSILNFINQYTSMTFGCPLSILFSNESGGLGGTTLTGDRLVWFDKVKSLVNLHLVPALETIVELFGLEQGVSTENITVKFNPLHELTEKEILENRKLCSETDKNYFEMGYPASNIFESRMSGDEFDFNTFIFDKKEFEEFQKQEEEKDLQEFENKKLDLNNMKGGEGDEKKNNPATR